MKYIIEYSTNIMGINSERFNGCCVHLLCFEGGCRFKYEDRPVEFGANEAVIINYPTRVSDVQPNKDFRCEIVVASLGFIQAQLPANHYGIGGSVSVYNNPVIPLSAADADMLHTDMQRIGQRLVERDHRFYSELMGSLILTMVYDIFEFHAKSFDIQLSGTYSADIVSRLNSLLANGRVKSERTVAYYADQLHVSPKYLSEIVKHKTGYSVMQLIDRYFQPMLLDYLKNTKMSLEKIALELNFSSVSYLCRYTKKHLGQSPKEFRATLIPRTK